MITDAEYADIRRLSMDEVAGMSKDAEEFSWFTWDLAAAVNPDGSPLCPELIKVNAAGVVQSKPAYRVLRHSETSLQRVLAKEADEEEEKRRAKLAEYIERGYAFDERALTDPRGVE